MRWKCGDPTWPSQLAYPIRLPATVMALPEIRLAAPRLRYVIARRASMFTSSP
jgi:hypothetical protein